MYEIIKKYTDTLVVISILIGGLAWMHGRFGDVDKEVHHLENKIDLKISVIEKDVTIIKTVLLMSGNYPKELAIKEGAE